MLEIEKILPAIDSLGFERAEAFIGMKDEIKTAAVQVSEISNNLEAVKSKIDESKTSWLVADLVDPPDKVCELPSPPEKHAVAAADGSQIMTDKHEVTLCFLLNASSIILYYGNGMKPEKRTVPALHYKDEDLFIQYDKKQVRITDRHVGNRRTVHEAAELESAIHRASKTGIPTVALFDGTLIRWEIESEPADYKKRILSDYLRVFETARELGIPIAGYISDPGSRDVVNAIKVNLCDQSPVDCDKCPYEDEKPCGAVGMLTDSIVYGNRLKDGKRSGLHISRSKILKEYGEHRIYAFYMNAGRETARIEIPEWVAKDNKMLELVHAVCFDQARKGRGYPVALSEAHEAAVVKSPERSLFFDMIERSFVKHGARITYSQKRRSKGY